MPRIPLVSDGASAQELLERLRGRAETVRHLRALADIRLVTNEQKLSASQVIVVERPDRLRIEVLSTFGVVLQFTTDGERLRAFDRGSRTFFEGSASPENLARFTQFELEPAEVVSLLLGLPTEEDRLGEAEVAFEEPTGLYRLHAVLSNRGAQNVWFDSERLLPVRSEVLDSEGERRYEAHYANYQPAGDTDVPHHIEIDVPASAVAITLDYSEATTSEPVDEALFRFAPPFAAKKVDLDAVVEPPR